MPVLRHLSLQITTSGAAAFLALLCLAVTWAQIEWSFRPETPGSPMDIAGLVLGHMLAVAALYASQAFVAGSRSRWTMTGMAALCYGLATAEYFLDAGLVDIPIAALWLAAGMFLLLAQQIGRDSARVWFLMAMGIAAAELIRNLAGAAFYGEGTELPPLFPWMDAGSDLLICVFYLLGFVELLGGGTAPAESPPADTGSAGPVKGSESVRSLLALASSGAPLRRASPGTHAPAGARPGPLAFRDASPVPRAVGWEVRLLVRDDRGEKVREDCFDVAIEDPLEAVAAVQRLVVLSDFSHAEVVAVAPIPADVVHALGLAVGEIKPQ